MLTDARELPSGRALQYDVCIIGGGAAGITIARALSASKRSVCLLESGGFEIEDDTQDLYRGSSDGPGLNPRLYLMTSRLRFLGGTTNHWSGWCRPLDEMDFEKRPWIPYSGWPLVRRDLAPYYQRAADVVQVKPFDDTWGVVDDQEVLLRRGGPLVGKCFRWSPPTRFGAVYRDELIAATSVTVLLHANVLQIDVNESGAAVTRVDVTTLTGRRFTVTAPVFVLAAGAIENARLLLLSNAVQKAGVGNQSDCVGRFFMEHPERMCGHIFLTDPGAIRDLDALRDNKGVVSMSTDAQRANEMLNVSIEIGPTSPLRGSDTDTMALEIGDALDAIDHLDQEQTGAASEGSYVRCFVRSEAAPNPDSRVTLSDDRDALGLRRPRLAWRSSTLEGRSIARALDITAREIGRRRLGRMLNLIGEEGLQSSLDQDVWRGVHGASHHMGTTRMSSSAADGVVDATCRVHGIDNLYVAGSSVFPAVGFANPTFTIVALALRLADHLATRVSPA